MQRGNCASARSGGDALRQRDSRCALLQDRLEEFPSHSLNAGNGMIKVDRHGAAQLAWIEKIDSCPVYYPTDDEFVDPLCYIQKIAPEASKYGMCKVVPPVVAAVPAGVVLTKEQTNFKFTTMIQPMRLPNWDNEDKNTFYMSGCHYTLAEYEKVANKEFARKFSTAAALPAKFVEAEFWKELVSGKTCSVEYANDVEGSAFSKSSICPLGESTWNLKKISRLPDSTLRLLNIMIPGVTEPMLYIGMLFSMFAWHVEDHYLYSINYHHCGAPKTWYGVPGNSASDFENIVKTHVYQPELLKDSGKGLQYNLLLQKTTMFAPKLLSENGVPVFRALQNPGEFVITFPRAYHAGFSHGFNCGEAVNFAMADWFPFGAAACLRYEFLNRMPLLPHEELLCKDAMLVSTQGTFPCGSRVQKQQNHVKIAFVALMRSQLQAHENIKKRGAKTISSSFMNVICGLCKHACYISYTTCSCCPEPVCLNHDRFLGGCMCDNLRSLVVRDNLQKLQAVAQMFEAENEILSKAMAEPSICDELVANAGRGAGEEEFLTRSLTVAPRAGDNLCEASLIQGKGPHCEGESYAHVRDGKGEVPTKIRQLQEDSSDSEAFRVKRRKVSHSCGKRFQVDEQEVDLAIDVKPIADSESSIKENGFAARCLFVRDVMNKLGIKGPKVEVIRRWQHCAKRRGLVIRTKWVPSAGRLVEALSFKSCMALKRLLTKDHACRLEMLMQRNSHTVKLNANSACSTQEDIKPMSTSFSVLKDIAEDSDRHKTVDKKKPQMLKDGVTDSCGFIDEEASFNGQYHAKWRNVDRMLVRKERKSEKAFKMGEEKADFDRKHCSKGENVKDNLLGNSGKHQNSDYPFIEGSSNSAFQCWKGTQAVSRLKIKSATPAEGSKLALSSVENDQEHLYGGTRNAGAVKTEKRVSKEHLGEGKAQAIVGAEFSKMDPVYCSKRSSQAGCSMSSCNVYKKRGRECRLENEKEDAKSLGLAFAKEPKSDLSGADSSLENLKAESELKGREGPMEASGYLGEQDSGDYVSQKADHKPEKLTVKLTLKKVCK